MAQVAQAASRGVDWENLLVETLALLHRIAMVQLLPSMLDNHYAAVEQRLRELARTLPPADVQLTTRRCWWAAKSWPMRRIAAWGLR